MFLKSMWVLFCGWLALMVRVKDDRRLTPLVLPVCSAIDRCASLSVQSIPNIKVYFQSMQALMLRNGLQEFSQIFQKKIGR